MQEPGLTVVCAWCRTVVCEGGERVSHGICPDCALKMLRQLPAHYLASIADADGTVSLFSGYKFPVPGGEDEETWGLGEGLRDEGTWGPGDEGMAGCTAAELCGIWDRA